VRDVEHREEIRPSHWSTRDRMFHGPGIIHYIILDTGGCHWARKTGGCSMCGFIADTCARDVSDEELRREIDDVVARIPDSQGPFGLKIFTSGSFLDTREISEENREYLLAELADKPGISEMTVESRPEFVVDESVSAVVSALPDVEVEVALGLESSSDWVRENCVGKGFSLEDFGKASRTARQSGARVKTYLLLKPPFMSEFDAAYDCVRSAKDISGETDSISINACNVQRGTLVQELFKRREYRPPWIWTVLDVLKQARDALPSEKNVICDTVAFGKRRGPYNCPRCNKRAVSMVEAFSLGQDPRELEGLECDCRGRWTEIYNYHF